MTYTEVTVGDSATTPATRNACRALRRNGMTTRPTTSAPTTSAHTVHQYARAHGAANVVPSRAWWTSATKIAR